MAKLKFAVAGLVLAWAALPIECGVGTLAPRAPGPREGAPFVDRFAAFDSAVRWFVSDGWSNGDWTANDFLATQIALTDQGLALTLAGHEPGAAKPFKGGEISTRAEYRFGYFEGRMRVPRGSGIVSGLFTYTPAEDASGPQEIDIEILGRDTRRIELTYHFGDDERKKIIDLGFDAADDFHVYGFEWGPGVIRWYVDGGMIHETHGDGLPIPSRPQKFFLDLWNSETLTGWVGPLDAREAPWVLTMSCMGYAPTYAGKPICAR